MTIRQPTIITNGDDASITVDDEDGYVRVDVRDGSFATTIHLGGLSALALSTAITRARRRAERSLDGEVRR